jgi:hypothetical protein
LYFLRFGKEPLDFYSVSVYNSIGLAILHFQEFQTMLFNVLHSYRPSLSLWPLSLGLLLWNGSLLPALADSATDWNQFDVCVTDLTTNGVNGNQAKSACAGALIPKQLSECVAMIRNGSPIEATPALQACYQVRRPVDLGNCVVDIQNSVLGGYTPPADATKGVSSNDLSLLALNSCRESLLPGRHSECVIALSRDNTTSSPQIAMDTCLAAEDFPRDLFPTYSQTQEKAQ